MTAERAFPVLGHLRRWRKDPLAFLRDCAAAGDIVLVHLPQPLYVLMHPDHVQHVLYDRHKNYRKGFEYERLKPLFGNGLLTSNRPEWFGQRKLLQPAFHRTVLARFVSSVTRRTNQMFKHWQERAETRPLGVAR